MWWGSVSAGLRWSQLRRRYGVGEMSWRYHLALKSGGVIAVARPHDHLRRPRRAADSDPDLSPLSVASLVGRRIAQAVLMAQFQRHARGRLLHLRSRVDEKRPPAGQPRDLI